MDMSTVVKVTKMVVGAATSVGIGAIVGNAIKATTPARVHIVTKICMCVGGAVLTGMLTDVAVKQVEGQIDGVAIAIKQCALTDEVTVEG